MELIVAEVRCESCRRMLAEVVLIDEVLYRRDAFDPARRTDEFDLMRIPVDGAADVAPCFRHVHIGEFVPEVTYADAVVWRARRNGSPVKIFR